MNLSQLSLFRIVMGMIVLTVFATVHQLNDAAAQSSPEHQVIETDQGNLDIYPINHATFVMKWDGKTIFVDPVGGKDPFQKFDTPDLILITDIHGDHLSGETLNAVSGESTKIIAPQAVMEKLSDANQKKTVKMANGQKQEILGIKIESIPMYNLTEERLKYHEKGRGNGYLLTVGGKRVYISGDTEDIPEMRNLKNIDVAFVCMNLPYTMTVEQAASAVNEFQPKIVYPYHYRNSDIEKFKELVTGDTEVRMLKWYE